MGTSVILEARNPPEGVGLRLPPRCAGCILGFIPNWTVQTPSGNKPSTMIPDHTRDVPCSAKLKTLRTGFLPVEYISLTGPGATTTVVRTSTAGTTSVSLLTIPSSDSTNGIRIWVLYRINVIIYSYSRTAGVMKTVPYVQCTLFLIITIYLSHNTQVAEGTVFREHTVALCSPRVFIKYIRCHMFINLTEVQLTNALHIGKVLWNGRYYIMLYY